WSEERLHSPMADLAALAEAAAITPSEELAEIDRDAVIKAAIAEVQATRRQWRRSDLMAAINRRLPDRLHKLGRTFEEFVTGLAEKAVSGGRGVLLLTAPDVVPVPEALQRSDGRSRFRPHRDERYATEAQLAAEERLVAAVRSGGAPF